MTFARHSLSYVCPHPRMKWDIGPGAGTESPDANLLDTVTLRSRYTCQLPLDRSGATAGEQLFLAIGTSSFSLYFQVLERVQY